MSSYGHSGNGDMYNTTEGGKTDVNYGIQYHLEGAKGVKIGGSQQTTRLIQNPHLREMLTLVDPQHERDQIQRALDDDGLTPSGLALRDSLLMDRMFDQWYKGRQGPVFWVRGDAGTGKTLLLVNLLDKLLPVQESDNGRFVVAYFFREGDPKARTSAADILLCLVKLLYTARSDSLLQPLEKHYECSKVERVAAKLSHVLELLVKKLEETVYLVIDGLSECEIEAKRILDLMKRMSMGYSNVRWIVSTRDQGMIDSCSSWNQDGLRAKVDLDPYRVSAAVELYIKAKVGSWTWLRSPRSRNEVVLEMKRKACGKLLWISLVCNELDAEDEDEDSVISALRDAPSDLDLMRLRAEARDKIDEGFKKIEEFDKDPPRSKRWELREEGMKLFQTAIEICGRPDVPYRIGLVRANLHLAECHLDKTHMKCAPEKKIEMIASAEQCIGEASRRVDRRDQRRSRRVDLASSFIQAQRARIEAEPRRLMAAEWRLAAQWEQYNGNTAVIGLINEWHHKVKSTLDGLHTGANGVDRYAY